MAFDITVVTSILKKHPLGFAALGLAIVLAVANTIRSGSEDDLQTRLQELTDQSSRLKNNLKYSAGLTEQLTAITAVSNEVSDRAINPASLATNLQYFYRLESDLRLKFTDLRQGVAPATKPGASFTSVPYTLAAEGTYAQLVDFLRRIETGTLLTRVLATNLSPSRAAEVGAQDPTNPVLSLNISLEVLGKQ
tara:strand:- start:146 stop:724 length:579 start_codon:yes stop_codon:yes gene_type:complete